MNEFFSKLIMYHQIHKMSRDGWSKSRISEFLGINWRTVSKYLKMSEEEFLAYIERFNRTYREEVLSAFLFESIEQIKEITHHWIWEYNNIRPHKSLMNMPPVQFLLKYGKLSEFPTFQKDIYINRKTINLDIAN